MSDLTEARAQAEAALAELRSGIPERGEYPEHDWEHNALDKIESLLAALPETPTTDDRRPSPPTEEQAEIITTEAEADALPVGAIILDNMGDARQKVTPLAWEQAGVEGHWRSAWIALPARVWLPEAAARVGGEA